MSPRTSEQNEKIRRERIGQIQRAAMEVYVEKGLLAAEIGDIAKRAGIARGLVYYYYKDKMDLYRDLFTLYLDAASVFIRNQLTKEAEPYERLKNYTMFYIDMAYKQPVLSKFYRKMDNDLEIVFSTEKDSISENYIQPSHDYLLKAFENAIENGHLKSYDPKLMVNLYWGALNGVLDLFTDGYIAPEEVEAKKNEVVELIFEGLT
ncbi:TetR/AcrR family transcriptional regulator [Falsibacillus pallidus]|uniref:TetR/AcrR family transcriptional regulator n=1 Tax=Falsibacillus pallidus TaxID=493781 RepID=UPI003D9682E1